MATTPETNDDQTSREHDTGSEGGTDRRRKWIVDLAILSAILVLFALIACAAIIAPDSAGSSDIQYWMVP